MCCRCTESDKLLPAAQGGVPGGPAGGGRRRRRVVQGASVPAAGRIAMRRWWEVCCGSGCCQTSRVLHTHSGYAAPPASHALLSGPLLSHLGSPSAVHPSQVLKERISCYGLVTAVEGGTATVRLALVLPDSIWTGRHRWSATPAAAQLFTHLAALPPPCDANGQQQGEQGEQQNVSYWQRLQQQLGGVRPPPAGTDPFRHVAGAVGCLLLQVAALSCDMVHTSLCAISLCCAL